MPNFKLHTEAAWSPRVPPTQGVPIATRPDSGFAQLMAMPQAGSVPNEGASGLVLRPAERGEAGEEPDGAMGAVPGPETLPAVPLNASASPAELPVERPAPRETAWHADLLDTGAAPTSASPKGSVGIPAAGPDLGLSGNAAVSGWSAPALAPPPDGATTAASDLAPVVSMARAHPTGMPGEAASIRATLAGFRPQAAEGQAAPSSGARPRVGESSMVMARPDIADVPACATEHALHWPGKLANAPGVAAALRPSAMAADVAAAIDLSTRPVARVPATRQPLANMAATATPEMARVDIAQGNLTDPAPMVRTPVAEPGDGLVPSMSPSPGAGSPVAPGALPVVTSPPPGVQSVTLQIAQGVVQAPGDRFELVLSPEELGRVRIQLHASEAGMHVLITTERPETLDFLRKNIAQLSRDLTGLGFDSARFEFSDGRAGGEQARAGHHREQRPLAEPPPMIVMTDNNVILQAGAGGGLDLRF